MCDRRLGGLCPSAISHYYTEAAEQNFDPGSRMQQADRPLEGVLHRPPAVLVPDRATFARALNAATRSLSLAHTHETDTSNASIENRRYELAYPLYLSAAQGFLYACKNIRHAGALEAPSNSGEGSLGADRVAKLRNNFVRQAKRAMERANKIREVKGADWAKRWGSGNAVSTLGLADVEAQARILRQSSSIYGLTYEPWLPMMEDEPSQNPQPFPILSPKQREAGTHFRRASVAKPPDVQVVLLDPARALRGTDITQDAVTNCGIVAALEVIAEHDRRWKSSLLETALGNGDLRKDLGLSASGCYGVVLHLNGCRRRVVVDDQLPYRQVLNFDPSETTEHPSMTMICASVAHPLGHVVLLPALVEKAYLTVLRTYAPQGTVPAEDLHVLTGWLPEVCSLPGADSDQKMITSFFQKERLWQRVYGGWSQGVLLLCAGTDGYSGSDVQHDTTGTLNLVPSHSYSILKMSTEGGQRSLTLMNPWRPRQNSAMHEFGLFKLDWDAFCARFATLHLAWDPIGLFSNTSEIHASWSRDAEETRAESRGSDQKATLAQAVRNVEFLLTVTRSVRQVDTKMEAAEEVWLHLSRHIGDSRSDEEASIKRFIALHIFPRERSNTLPLATAHQEVRISPLGGNHRGAGDYVDAAHHIVRFKPNFLVDSLLCYERGIPLDSSGTFQKQFIIVASLHYSVERHFGNGNFTLRAWSRHGVALEDPETTESDGSIGSWSCTLTGAWTPNCSAGGSNASSLFYTNPQYLVSVPASTSSLNLRLNLQTTPPVPCHLTVVYAPRDARVSQRHLRVDRVDGADVVGDSGPYANGIAKAEAALPATGPSEQGRYVIVVSTFSAGQEAMFKLKVSCHERRLVASQRSVLSVPLVGGPSNSQSNAHQSGDPSQGEVVMINPLLPEGAGLYHKSVKASWSVAEGTAAGAPRWGRYEKNPTWLLYAERSSFEEDGSNDAKDNDFGTLASPRNHVQANFRLIASARPSPSGVTTRAPRSEAEEAEFGAEQNHPSSPPAINLSLFPVPPADNGQSPKLGRDLYTTGPYSVAPCGVALHGVCLPLSPSRDDDAGHQYILVASTFEVGVEADFILLGWCGMKRWAWRRL